MPNNSENRRHALRVASLDNPRGRLPDGDKPAGAHIHLRVTLERKNRYVRAARKLKLKLSEWMTEACDNASTTES